MIRLTATLLLLALSLPTVALFAQETSPQPVGTRELTLLPGDLIGVTIYREPDLNGEFLVDEEGFVILPLLGETKVTGIPMRQLRVQLVDAYRQHLRNPAINITPMRRVNVLGEVQKPGMYTIDPTVSLAGAIALAGGATGSGSLKRIRIVRGDQVLYDRVGASETLSEVNIRSGDQIFVDRRSWFERNSTFVISTMLSMTSIVTTIILATRRN